MAITLLTLNGTTEDKDVYVDVENYDDETFMLKQYDGGGDWIELTKPMLRQLVEWARKETV